MDRVTVIGAGSWGTVVAGLAGRNAEVVLWARDPARARELSATRINSRYLPGVELPRSVSATDDLDHACGTGASALIMAVPSHGFRDVFTEVARRIPDHVLLLSVAKGVERGTLLRMSEVMAQVRPGGGPVAVLTGPNLASEVAARQPAASVVACADESVALAWQQVLMTDRFRVYTNPDVVGCELAGALKNVIAIAVGVAAGLGYGDNAAAALITRGLAELARLGVALGGDPLTFSGLAGMGDLVATCTSDKSRNRHVGVEIGHGRTLAEIVAESSMVAEGVNTAASVVELAERRGVDVPISRMVAAILHDGRRPEDVLGELMTREVKPELHGLQ